MSDRKSPTDGNLFDALPCTRMDEEIFEPLISLPGARIERIVSTGQITAPDEWYDQVDDEWVAVLAGAARLQIEGEAAERDLVVGDWVFLPAHCRHRVNWTQDSPPTVWLAIHVAVSR